MPLRFRPGGLELRNTASLTFWLKCGSLPPIPSASHLLDDRELGKTRWVGGNEMLEDDGMEYGGELEVLLLLLLWDSDPEA